MIPRIRLFFTFMKIGAFTFGGGFAMIPILEREIVQKSNMLNEDDFYEIISVVQSFPGALAVNISTFLGYQLFGFVGALIGCLGVVLPSFLVILLVATLFQGVLDKPIVEKVFTGIHYSVIALIAASAFKLSKKIDFRNRVSIVLLVSSLFLIICMKINPIFIIIATGCISILYKKYHMDRGCKRVFKNQNFS